MSRKLIADPQRISQHFLARDFLHTHTLAVTQLVQYHIFSGEIPQALHQRQRVFLISNPSQPPRQDKKAEPKSIELGGGILDQRRDIITFKRRRSVLGGNPKLRLI